jgi:hypothetical protein
MKHTQAPNMSQNNLTRSFELMQEGDNIASARTGEMPSSRQMTTSIPIRTPHVEA